MAFSSSRFKTLFPSSVEFACRINSARLSSSSSSSPSSVLRTKIVAILNYLKPRVNNQFPLINLLRFSSQNQEIRKLSPSSTIRAPLSNCLKTLLPSSSPSLSYIQRNKKALAPKINKRFKTSDKESDNFTPGRSKVQQLRVYEINEKGSLAQKSANTLVGDIILSSNKLYTADLRKPPIGTVGGRCRLMGINGELYEVIYRFNFGDYGHISVEGLYLTSDRACLAVTGGSGIFQGAYGRVELRRVVLPTKKFYTFYLRGIRDLPIDLVVLTRGEQVLASTAAAVYFTLNHFFRLVRCSLYWCSVIAFCIFWQILTFLAAMAVMGN